MDHCISLLFQGSKVPTVQEIAEDIQKLYKKKFVPFLENVCVEVEGQDKHIWKWLSTNGDSVSEFVEQVFVTQFQNLTSDGTVSHSHEFFRLFPNISQISDPNSIAAIPQVCSSIRAGLQTKGLYLPEVDIGMKFLLICLFSEETH
jgi:hypothetical protein